MLDSDMEAALNRQFNWEQTAAQEYLAMSAWFEDQSLRGFAGFMRKQCEEETEHAMRIHDYLCQRGGRVRPGAVAAPALDFDSPRMVFEAAQSRERANTKAIHELYHLAAEKRDMATQIMLHWFIAEQVEEEGWCDEALALLEMVGDNKSAMLMLDSRYGKEAREPG